VAGTEERGHRDADFKGHSWVHEPQSTPVMAEPSTRMALWVWTKALSKTRTNPSLMYNAASWRYAGARCWRSHELVRPKWKWRPGMTVPSTASISAFEAAGIWSRVLRSVLCLHVSDMPAM
jgi:hypothetical protein